MRLLPRNDKFFDLLLEHGRLALEAARLLTDALADAGPRNLQPTSDRARDLKQQGEAHARRVSHQLHQTFITPIDPEDIHETTTQVGEVLTHLEAATYRFCAYAPDMPRDVAREIARLVQGCVEGAVDALELLDHHGLNQPEALTARCEEIRRRRLLVEDRVRAAVATLFRTERDAITVIKRKEVLEFLEAAADDCKGLADVLEAIAVKNS